VPVAGEICAFTTADAKEAGNAVSTKLAIENLENMRAELLFGHFLQGYWNLSAYGADSSIHFTGAIGFGSLPSWEFDHVGFVPKKDGLRQGDDQKHRAQCCEVDGVLHRHVHPPHQYVAAGAGPA